MNTKQIIAIQKAEKMAMQHAIRMSKRPQWDLDMSIDMEYVMSMSSNDNDYKCYDLAKLIAQQLVKTHKDTIILGAYAPMYYNDTFLPNGKPWYEDVYGNILKIVIAQEDAYKLVLFIDQHGRLVVDHIETLHKGNGLGTEIMNIVLDVCDLTETECVLVPTDLTDYSYSKTKNAHELYTQVQKNTNRLRNWYISSFGFKAMSPFTAKLIYQPEF